MGKTDVIEKLMNFHLSRPEATVYLCLIENGRLTGYEAGKLTGISRSNVYGALNVLADKGAAMVQESGNTTYYVPVGLEEFLTNRIRSLKNDKEYLVKNISGIIHSQEGYLTIRGADNIRDKAYHMIVTCEMRLYLAASKEIVELLWPALLKAKGQGLKIVVISDEDYSDICTNYYFDQSEKGQIRLITDSTFVLTGELTGSSTDTCLYSGQENLVTVMKEALRNKIKLLEIEERKKEG